MPTSTPKSRDDEDTINIWKIAPGKKAWFWDNWRKWNCITISWLNNKNFWNYADKDSLTEELRKADEGDSGAARSIWQFVHEIQVGDIVAANKGKSCVLAIGVVASEYLPPDDPRNPNKVSERHRHARRIDWLIDEPIEIDDDLFGYRIPPTVLRLTLEQFDQIKQAYLRESPNLKAAFDRLFAARDRPPHKSSVVEDLDEVSRRTDIKSTTKQALVDARVGQGKFRDEVLRSWGQCCAVTGSTTLDAIRASHIKPWRESNDEERLDCHNGLPLVASLDALFDAGWISFESSGRLIVSSKLSSKEQRIFGLGECSLRKPPAPKTEAYLAYHRKNVFDE